MKDCPGIQGLTVFRLPTALRDIPEEHPEEGDEFEYIRDYYGGDRSFAEVAKEENFSGHILVAVDVCRFEYLTFNTDTAPYSLINIMGINESDQAVDSFLHYLVGYFGYYDEVLKDYEVKLALEDLKRKDPENSYKVMNNIRKKTYSHDYFI